MRRVAFWLCVAAGVFYNSWPLGYWLDNQTARHDLASDLEQAGHPFYWLFVSCDIFMALLLITAVAVLSFKRRPALKSNKVRLILVGLLMFGCFTAAAALLPAQCEVTPLFRCDAGNGWLSLDAITSSLAALGLIISLVTLSLSSYKSGGLTRLTRIVLAAWTLSGLVFTALALSTHDARLSQNIFMILCGVGVAVIGLNLAIESNRCEEG